MTDITELVLRLKLEVHRAVSNFNPQMNIKTRDLKELVEALEKAQAINAAAEKLVRCKGRYHSEQNYRALAALFGVTTPDLPPLDGEPVGEVIEVGDALLVEWHKNLEEGAKLYTAPQAPVMPFGLHPDTQKLVTDFCTALAEKLYKAQLKYGYDTDWKQDGWPSQCQAHFHQHIAKGDPRDVAAYCAFMWYHGWKTEAAQTAPVVTFYRDGIEAAAKWIDKQREAYDSEHGRYDTSTGFFEFGNDAQREYSSTLEELAEGIRALHPNAGNSPAIPEGYVMVPKEPTEQMYDAGDRQMATKQVWDAMLAAAPQQHNAPQNSPEIIPGWIPVSERMPDCWCRTCRPVVLNDMRFVVCPDCGNKRCPRANDHRNACTGSNEPGQEGSAYPDTQQEGK